jgi:MFS family permease
MLVRLGVHTSLWWLIASYTVFAVGFGMVNAPITNSAVSGMPMSQAGVAAAVASTSRQVGAALGVAVVGSVLSSGLGHLGLATGFTAASRAGWSVVVGCGLVVLVLGLAASSRWAHRTAESTARLFDDDGGKLAVAA